MNGEPSPTPEKLSDIFRRMADQIDVNGDKNFGGAFVIVPPKPGVPIETLILDNRQNAAQFYATLKTTAEIALNDVIKQNQQNAAFGVR